MTIEEITDLIEQDFPQYEWLVRANSGSEGRYFSNATLRDKSYGLRSSREPLPPFAAFGNHPVDALCKTYSALVKANGVESL